MLTMNAHMLIYLKGQVNELCEVTMRFLKKVYTVL